MRPLKTRCSIFKKYCREYYQPPPQLPKKIPPTPLEKIPPMPLKETAFIINPYNYDFLKTAPLCSCNYMANIEDGFCAITTVSLRV
jgi:hypothetical protein